MPRRAGISLLLPCESALRIRHFERTFEFVGRSFKSNTASTGIKTECLRSEGILVDIEVRTTASYMDDKVI